CGWRCWGNCWNCGTYEGKRTPNAKWRFSSKGRLNMNPWIWAIGSIAVAIAEIHSLGCYLIWVAAGGLITSLLSFLFDLSFATQLIIFVVSSAGTSIIGFGS